VEMAALLEATSPHAPERPALERHIHDTVHLVKKRDATGQVSARARTTVE